MNKQSDKGPACIFYYFPKSTRSTCCFVYEGVGKRGLYGMWTDALVATVWWVRTLSGLGPDIGARSPLKDGTA